MDTHTRKERLIGVVMLGSGLAYLVMTMNLPRKGFIDAAFVPYVLAFILCLLGVLQLMNSRKPANAAKPAEADDEEKVPADYPTVLKTLGLIVLYTALLSTVGFPIMTALYLYAQFIVLTPAGQKANHIGYAAIAVVASLVIYYIFRHGFDLLLPSGFLDL